MVVMVVTVVISPDLLPSCAPPLASRFSLLNSIPSSLQETQRELLHPGSSARRFQNDDSGAYSCSRDSP